MYSIYTLIKIRNWFMTHRMLAKQAQSKEHNTYLVKS